MPELKEAPKDPTLGNKVLDAEAIKRQSSYFGGKKRLDEIEESLNKRVSEGNSVTHQIKSIEKSDQVVFKLKVNGPLPELKEAPRDPTLGVKKLDAEGMLDRERKSMYFGGKNKSDEI